MTLVTVKEVAEMLSVSQRQVWRLNSLSEMPSPIRIGRSVRWDSEVLRNWVSLGCPDRATFEQSGDL